METQWKSAHYWDFIEKLTEAVKRSCEPTASTGWRFWDERMGSPTREKLRRSVMGFTISSTQPGKSSFTVSQWTPSPRVFLRVKVQFLVSSKMAREIRRPGSNARSYVTELWTSPEMKRGVFRCKIKENIECSAFTFSCDKYVLSTFYGPWTISGAGDTCEEEDREIWSLATWSLHFGKETST